MTTQPSENEILNLLQTKYAMRLDSERKIIEYAEISQETENTDEIYLTTKRQALSSPQHSESDDTTTEDLLININDFEDWEIMGSDHDVGNEHKNELST